MKSFVYYLLKTLQKNNNLLGFSIRSHFKIYHEWKSQINSKRDPIDFRLPWINIPAKDFIVDYLKNKTEVKIFEFGSGGSTLFFLNYSNYVISVEHDEEWFNVVKKRISELKVEGWSGNLIKPEPQQNKQTMQSDIGDPLKYISSDKNYENYNFKNYATFIGNFPDNYFDVILVDGRSRPSCFWHSMNKVKVNGLLILDNAERDYYLSGIKIFPEKFKLAISPFSAIICTEQFSKTNIYIRTK